MGPRDQRGETEQVALGIKKMGNPYAKLSVEDDFLTEAGSSKSLFQPTRTSKNSALNSRSVDCGGAGSATDSVDKQEGGDPTYRDYCNPYLKLSAEGFDDNGNALPKVRRKSGGISKEHFNRRVREILAPYLPNPNTRGTQPVFVREFIDQVNERDPFSREKALSSLERYDLSGVSSGLEPLFNRDREDALKNKLNSILKDL